jgi:hypothetical protein
MLHFIRKTILFSLLISTCGCSGRPGPAAVDIIPQSTDASPAAGTQREDELAVFGQNLIDDYQSVLEEMGTATRYQIDLQIRDSVADVSGHQEVLYTNNEEVPLNEIYFRLFPNISGLILTVTNLTVDGASVPGHP